MITRALHALTDASVSRWGKFVVMALWFVIAVALVIVAPPLASIYNNNVTLSIPSNADSQVAQRLLLEKFPADRGTPAIVVFYDAHGLNADDRARAKSYNDWLTSSTRPVGIGPTLSIFTVPQAASQLVSHDGTTMTIITTLTVSSADAHFAAAIQAMRARLTKTIAGSSLQAHVTGPAGISTDAGAIFAATDLPLLLATVGLVLILLIALYRSPILAFLPLVGVGWALQIVDALLGFAGKLGVFGVSQQATSIMIVLLFGAGTDYSIFIAARFREELQRTEDKHDAMRTTMRAVGEAITSSAGTVILALLTLIFAAIGLYNTLGPTLAIAVFVMLLGGLTLIPALLTWLGRASYWPFIPAYAPQTTSTDVSGSSQRGFWAWLGHWTRQHRVAAVVSSVIVLAILALGNIGSAPTFNFLTAFRQPTDSSRGYAILRDHFPAGSLAPTTALITLTGANADVYQRLVAVDAITVAAQKVPGVATVQGPTRPDGGHPLIAPAALQRGIAQLPPAIREAIRSGQGAPSCHGPQCPPVDPQLEAIIGAYAASTTYVSPDETTFQIPITLNTDPYSLTAIDRIAPLRAALNRAIAANGLGAGSATVATLHLAGQTSLLADTYSYNQRDTLLIVPVVLLLVGIVLALLLRSLIAPLYLLGAVTLNFLASIGLCAFIFQRIQGQDGFSYAIPLYTFIFLVALGADYTIFLMARIREEAQRRGLEEGVPVAVARTGGVITSAGLILAGTFAVLTTLPLRDLYQFGICVAVGVLLDTFMVRGLFTPGIVLLLGRWNWWPGGLGAIHNPMRSGQGSGGITP